MTLISRLILAASLATACNSEPRRAPAPVASVATAASVTTPSSKPQFIRWQTGGLPLEQFVQSEFERAENESARVLVYVGATWCEPCKHFHEAIEHGDLDQDLAGTRFLEFDLDQHGEQLKAAGYRSKYIPLLAVPDPDGRASSRMIEGSIKGPGAVRENLLPRLRELLAR